MWRPCPCWGHVCLSLHVQLDVIGVIGLEKVEYFNLQSKQTRKLCPTTKSPEGSIFSFFSSTLASYMRLCANIINAFCIVFKPHFQFIPIVLCFFLFFPSFIADSELSSLSHLGKLINLFRVSSILILSAHCVVFHWLMSHFVAYYN